MTHQTQVFGGFVFANQRFEIPFRDNGLVLSSSTCTKNGETMYTCTDCGMTNIVKETTVEHNWDDGAVSLEASCTALGEILYTCTDCLTTKTESIAMLPHDYSAADGSCIVCGEPPYLYNKVVMKGAGTATVSVSTSDYDYYSSSSRPYYSKIITFVPMESGTYTFKAGASVDTYGRLYDANMKSLPYNDDGGGSSQFLITYNCTAGKVYYLAVGRYSNSSSTTSIPVTITKTS